MLIYAALINAASFIAFGLDKRAAVKRQWRISEKTLLSLAFIGGAAGALFGQKTFRHKTRKQPFKSLLYGCAAVNVIMGFAMLSPALRDDVIKALRQSFGM